MIPYHAPSRDMQFVINELNDLEEIAQLHEFADHDIGPDLVNAVLEEAGKLAHGVLAPLNRDGDQNGATLGENGVKAVRGFGEAYRQFIEGGWNGLVCPIEFGGQGLPELLNIATQEMWNSANLAFALCPLLTAGAVEALRAHGSEEQKQRYLIKMISGEWTGTMNLTEPQA
ncbi:MAG: acyl-CoA dehydrogenase family protein, partial [Candidatus Competibacteraceae bacterium]|nr:acyl-CoA dehydrogenase family protein [Candidatus Competibacteraceae bacterium]